MIKKNILMLSFHDPKEDPRIHWEAVTLSKLHNVIVIGTVVGIKKVQKSIIKHGEYKYRIILIPVLPLFSNLKAFHSFVLLHLINTSLVMHSHFIIFALNTYLYKFLFKFIYRFDLFNHLHYFLSFSFNLYEYIHDNRINYDIVHCNDLYTLPAGVALKSKEVKLLYDPHEIYPEVISYAPWYIRNYLKYIEKNLIKFADVTFAVSPQIKAWIKKEYKVTNVVVLPNAEIWKKASPMNSGLEKYFRNRIIFLYQGGFHSGRGLEELMDYWKDIDSSKAVLVLRGPKNQSFLSLNATSKQMIDSKRIVFAEKVKENELISAAMEADVGIIPYDGKNLNNRYSCPNKLSQYMHAGLAILHSDLPYVNSLVNKYKCGLSYQVDNKTTFVNSVNKMIHNPNLLRSMKVNSYESGRKSFNWEANEKLYLKYV